MTPRTEEVPSIGVVTQSPGRGRQRRWCCDAGAAARAAIRGHDVSIAHVGVAGLALARTQQPDAVVLEGMPGMSGYTVARELRGDPALKGVLLIALAGWDQEDARLRSAQAGFDYHLVKPVGPATLVELLARYPRGIRSAREDA